MRLCIVQGVFIFFPMLSLVYLSPRKRKNVLAEIEESIPTFKKDVAYIIVGVFTRIQSQSQAEQIN